MSIGHAPNEPGYSCPVFDEAIAQIEAARSINADLREWGTWWKERAEQLEEELEEDTGLLRRQLDERDDEITEKEREIAELQQRVAELERENNTLEADVSRLTDWSDRVGPR